MAIGVRVKHSGSWLDPHCAGLLGWKLGKRLWRRCAGEIGLFLTLTYRRDEYASSSRALLSAAGAPGRGAFHASLGPRPRRVAQRKVAVQG